MERDRTIAYDPEAQLLGDYRCPEVSGFDRYGRFDPAAPFHPDFRPQSAVDGFNETFLVQLPDGAILAILRQQGVRGGKQLELFRSVSADGGRSWSEPRPIGIQGMSPWLHRSPGGRLLLFYRRHAPHGGEEAGVAASWSEDGGETWQGEVALVDPLGHRYTSEYQAGYPTAVTLTDRHILVVFYSYSPALPGRYLAANLLEECA